MVAGELEFQMQRLGINEADGPSFVNLIAAQAERAKTLRELADKSVYFYRDVEYNADAVKQHLTKDATFPLAAVCEELQKLDDWNKESIHQCVSSVSEKLGLKLGKIAQPLRVAVSGNTISPPIDITLTLLGRDKTLQRINAALAICQN